MKARFVHSMVTISLVVFGLNVANASSFYERYIQPILSNCPSYGTDSDIYIGGVQYYADWQNGRVMYTTRCMSGADAYGGSSELADSGGGGTSGGSTSGGSSGGSSSGGGGGGGFPPTEYPGGGPTVGGSVTVKSLDPNENPTKPDEPCDNCGPIMSGSKILPTSRAMGQTVAVVGAPFNMVYITDKVAGRKGFYRLRIPISDDNSAVTGHRINAIFGNGRSFDQTFTNTKKRGAKYEFEWDGKDASNNDVLGTTEFTYVYTIFANGLRTPIYLKTYLGHLNAKLLGFGGWLPSIYHFYDFNTQKLMRGDGTNFKQGIVDIGSGEFRTASKDGNEVYIFNSEGKHLRTLFGLTGATKYNFVHDSTSGFLVSIEEPFGQTTTFTRSGDQVTQIISPKGQVTNLTYNSGGYLRAIANPAGERFKFTYYSSGLMKTFQDPDGHTSSYYYDSEGALSANYHSSGKYVEHYRSFNDPVDWQAQKVVSTTRLGKETSVRYTNAIELVNEFNYAVDDSLNRRVWYRKNDNLASSKYHTYSTSTGFQKDPRFTESSQYISTSALKIGGFGAKTEIKKTAQLTDPNDPFSIDELITTATTNANTYTGSFDGALKKWTISSPEGRVVTEAIDDFERPTQTQIGSLLPINYQYHDDGNLKSIQQGHRKASFEYKDGFLSSVTNSLGAKTQFIRDSVGRVTRQISPDGRAIEFSYDKNGNPVSITPPSKPKHSFLLNAFDKLSKYLPPTLAGYLFSTDYFYDLDGKLKSVRKPNGDLINYSYTSAPSVVLDTIQTPYGNYEFAHNPNLAVIDSIKSPDNYTLNFSYSGPFIKEETLMNGVSYIGGVKFLRDSEHRVQYTVVEDTSGNISSIKTTYDRDGLFIQQGSMRYIRNNRGQVTEQVLDRAQIKYTYDSSHGELIRIAYYFDGVLKWDEHYSRDTLGRIVKTDNGSVGKQYFYDKSGRLIGVQSTNANTFDVNIVYDDNGNRKSLATPSSVNESLYDDQDRLLSNNEFQYQYNQNGELQTKTQLTTSDVSSYTYDSMGNLREVVLPDTTVISYRSDGRNRRIERTVNSVVQSRYLYQSQLRIAAELDETGNMLKRYVYGIHINVPDWLTYNGSRFIVVKDIRGSVRRVVNSSTGELVQSMDYDEWGKITKSSGLGFQPFGYAGGLYDETTNLVRFGARDYDAETGRWLSKDPIGFNGGDTNLYSYVFQDPINFIDYDGLDVKFGPGTTMPKGLDQTAVYKYLHNNNSIKVLISQGKLPKGTFGVTLEPESLGSTIKILIDYEQTQSRSVSDPCLETTIHELIHADQYIDILKANGSLDRTQLQLLMPFIENGMDAKVKKQMGQIK